MIMYPVMKGNQRKSRAWNDIWEGLYVYLERRCGITNVNQREGCWFKVCIMISFLSKQKLTLSTAHFIVCQPASRIFSFPQGRCRNAYLFRQAQGHEEGDRPHKGFSVSCQ